MVIGFRYDRRVFVIPKNAADWGPNLTGRQYRGCHLVKQWLKQVVIGTVDQDYFRGCFPQSFGGGQSSETAAHDLPVAIDVS